MIFRIYTYTVILDYKGMKSAFFVIIDFYIDDILIIKPDSILYYYFKDILGSFCST